MFHVLKILRSLVAKILVYANFRLRQHAQNNTSINERCGKLSQITRNVHTAIN
jgi:hypothetical protein